MFRETRTKSQAANNPGDESRKGQQHGSRGHEAEKAPFQERPAEGSANEHRAPASQVESGHSEEHRHQYLLFLTNGGPSLWNIRQLRDLVKNGRMCTNASQGISN